MQMKSLQDRESELRQVKAEAEARRGANEVQAIHRAELLRDNIVKYLADKKSGTAVVYVKDREVTVEIGSHKFSVVADPNGLWNEPHQSGWTDDDVLDGVLSFIFKEFDWP
jgi:hypothetical protein